MSSERVHYSHGRWRVTDRFLQTPRANHDLRSIQSISVRRTLLFTVGAPALALLLFSIFFFPYLHGSEIFLIFVIAFLALSLSLTFGTLRVHSIAHASNNELALAYGLMPVLMRVQSAALHVIAGREGVYQDVNTESAVELFFVFRRALKLREHAPDISGLTGGAARTLKGAAASIEEGISPHAGKLREDYATMRWRMASRGHAVESPLEDLWFWRSAFGRFLTDFFWPKGQPAVAKPLLLFGAFSIFIYPFVAIATFGLAEFVWNILPDGIKVLLHDGSYIPYAGLSLFFLTPLYFTGIYMVIFRLAAGGSTTRIWAKRFVKSAALAYSVVLAFFGLGFIFGITS